MVAAVAAAGADAVEVGIPFSDPVMDGPTIQEASTRALAAGATPASVVSALGDVDAGIPLVVMTYYNVVFRGGHRRFARSLVEHGVAGAIVPDLPLDEFGDWGRAADDADVETILLATYLTIGLSVLAHGATAAPMARAYARWYESHPRRERRMENDGYL